MPKLEFQVMEEMKDTTELVYKLDKVKVGII